MSEPTTDDAARVHALMQRGPAACAFVHAANFESVGEPFDLLFEPHRLSRRPVGLSQTWLGLTVLGSDFFSSSPPQGPPEAPRLGHVLMVQPSCSAADLAGLFVDED